MASGPLADRRQPSTETARLEFETPAPSAMTSQGSAHGRFTRALAQRNLRGAETAAKEMGGLSLIDALDYLVMLAEVRPNRAPAAAIRWHGRFELESVTLSLVESQLALAALADLCAGSKESVPVLKRLLRRVRPTMLPRVS